MRLTTDFFVSAIIRQVQTEGGFAYLARRGAKEAGALFIKINMPLGIASLYGPAPQTYYDTEKPEDRCFIQLCNEAEEFTCAEKIEKELRFDPDLWLLELENVAKLEQLIKIVPDPYA